MSIAGVIATVLRQDAPYQAEIAMGAQLIMDFRGARSGRRPYYWYRGTRYTSPEKIPGWSFSRNSVGYAEDSFGNLIQFPANAPRATDRGLLLEEARTNGTANNQMVGAVAGSPGTMPNGWSFSGSAAAALGLTQTIATGSTDGIPFFEVTLTGTPNTSGGTGFYFTGNHPNNPMSAGQVWTASAYLQVVGTPVGVNRLDVGIVQRNSGGGNTGGGSTLVTPMPTTRARFAYTHTITDATTVGGQANVSVSFSVGVPVSITYRIWLPQLEQGSPASSPIPTAGATATRPADNPSIQGQSAILGQFRTNWIPNSSMAGAAVGALPSTGWSTSVGNGVAGSVVGVGSTAEGLPYIDVRVQGTPAATTNFGIYTSAGNVVSAASGQAWTASVYSAIVAGAAPAGTKYGVWESDGSGNYLAEASVNVPASTLTRYAATRVFNQAGTVYARAVFVAPVTSGVPVDFTIRIAAPQLERGASATEWVPTTTAAASAGSPATLVAVAELPTLTGVDRRVAVFHDGTAGNREDLRITISNLPQATSLTGGVATSLVGAGLSAGVVKLASRVRKDNLAASFNGGAVNAVAALAPAGLSTVSLGQANAGGGYLNGYLQRVMILGDVDDAQLQRLAA